MTQTGHEVLLPPPSLALVMHQAAAVIRSAAEKARAEMANHDYWRGNWAAEIDNLVGDRVGPMLTLFSPGNVLELADWLDEVGAHGARNGDAAIPKGAGYFAREVLDSEAA
jgi:hypothetical protein